MSTFRLPASIFAHLIRVSFVHFPPATVLTPLSVSPFQPHGQPCHPVPPRLPAPQVGSLRQFRQLFLLLIGQCRLGPASLPYLRDLVLTNHLLISIIPITIKIEI